MVDGRIRQRASSGHLPAGSAHTTHVGDTKDPHTTSLNHATMAWEQAVASYTRRGCRRSSRSTVGQILVVVVVVVGARLDRSSHQYEVSSMSE